MLSQNIISYRERTLELERERINYMRCNIMIDIILVIGVIIIIILIILYVIFVVINGKTITIS